jgi:hypothetical protein
MDIVSGKSRTKVLTNMFNSASRDDIFTKRTSNPDGNIYLTTNYIQSLKLFNSN